MIPFDWAGRCARSHGLLHSQFLWRKTAGIFAGARVVHAALRKNYLKSIAKKY
jgi:hypothetical protein